MPELPEVETVRRDLEKEVVGRRIKAVQVSGTRTVRRQAKKAFTARVEGTKIDGVSRRGKNLLLSLGDDILVIHLGMSGQLLKATAKEPVIKHTHLRLTLQPGGEIRFVDPRTFGEVYVASKEHLRDEAQEIADLGFDPLDDVISWNDFGARLMARKVKLKTLLTDQKFIAGIGNIYSDEILWNAGLRYDRSSETLSTQEVRRLSRAIAEVLQEAVKFRGSSLSDMQYCDLYGNPGQYQTEHKVYGRDGEPCRRCRHTIEKVKWGGRSAFYCPGCQV